MFRTKVSQIELISYIGNIMVYISEYWWFQTVWLVICLSITVHFGDVLTVITRVAWRSGFSKDSKSPIWFPGLASKLSCLDSGVASPDFVTYGKTMDRLSPRGKFIMAIVIFYCQGKCLFMPVVYVSLGFESLHIKILFSYIKSCLKVNFGDLA